MQGAWFKMGDCQGYVSHTCIKTATLSVRNHQSPLHTWEWVKRAAIVITMMNAAIGTGALIECKD